MTFEDATLIRLADPATRATVFDQTALEQFLNAAYDTSVTPMGGPFSAVFEEFRLGLPVSAVSTVNGTWGPQSGSERSAGSFELAGLGGPPLLMDAFWRGFVVARTSAGTGRISDVSTNWPSTGVVDEEIVAALGALPADPAQLEQERRARLIAKLKAGMADADALTDPVFDAIVSRLGATSVSELFERHRGVHLAGSVTVTFQEQAAPPPTPKPMPIAAALLVRSPGFAVGRLLLESRLMRERLQGEGMARPEEARFRVRNDILVIWIAPITMFDDEGWPGAAAGDSAAVRRTKRRAAAGRWLAAEGIGLATVPV